MANTTWNPSDLNAVTLSGSNLIATANSGGAWVRSIDRLVTGKFYWEVTMTTWASTSTGIGLTNDRSIPTVWNAQGLLTLFNNGAIYLSGSQVASGLTGATTGATIGFALDAGAQLMWFRVAPSGNWNGNAGANPATGTGGLSIVSIGGGGIIGPVYALAQFAAASDRATANFGDTAFSGAVPAGFTSGFTAGIPITNYEVATQLAAETWAAGTPTLQLTQIAIEEWAAVSTTNPQLALTQIAIEEWASVLLITPSVGAPMITMIG